MKKAENEEYLIIKTENKDYKYPYFIFNKKSEEVVIANKSEIENRIYRATDKENKEIKELCKKGGII